MDEFIAKYLVLLDINFESCKRNDIRYFVATFEGEQEENTTETDNDSEENNTNSENYNEIKILTICHDGVLQVIGKPTFKLNYENRELLDQVCIFMTRLNNKYSLGCFKLDFDDGELTFCISADFSDSIPPFPVFKKMFYFPVMILKEMLPYFREMQNEGLSGDVAFVKSELDKELAKIQNSDDEDNSDGDSDDNLDDISDENTEL